MKVTTKELIDHLQADVREMILKTGYLKTESLRHLVTQPAPGKWSVAQILEHLNSYGRYYLPAIEQSMIRSNMPAQHWFVSGWLGNYFTRIMRPGMNGKIVNKMKTPREHRPLPVFDIDAVLRTFVDQQFTLLNLLEDAQRKDIGAIRTPISISRFIRLKTGDTFRFLIAHEQRHFVQIENTLRQIKEAEAAARSKRDLALLAEAV